MNVDLSKIVVDVIMTHPHLKRDEQIAIARQRVNHILDAEFNLPSDIDYVKQSIEKIKTLANSDPEAAGSEEYNLWKFVLSSVALRHPDSVVLAGEAIKSIDIQFNRYV
jgi:hypothetical protein